MFMFWWKLCPKHPHICHLRQNLIHDCEFPTCIVICTPSRSRAIWISWKYLHCFKLAILFSTSKNQNSMVARPINTATSLSLVCPYSMFCFADQCLSSQPNFQLRVMYQRVCLSYERRWFLGIIKSV